MYYIRVRAYDATTTTDLGSYRISTDNVRLCGIRSQTRSDSAVYAHLVAVTDPAVYDLSQLALQLASCETVSSTRQVRDETAEPIDCTVHPDPK